MTVEFPCGTWWILVAAVALANPGICGWLWSRLCALRREHCTIIQGSGDLFSVLHLLYIYRVGQAAGDKGKEKNEGSHADLVLDLTILD